MIENFPPHQNTRHLPVVLSHQAGLRPGLSFPGLTGHQGWPGPGLRADLSLGQDPDQNQGLDIALEIQEPSNPVIDTHQNPLTILAG